MLDCWATQLISLIVCGISEGSENRQGSPGIKGDPAVVNILFFYGMTELTEELLKNIVTQDSSHPS